MSTQPAQTAVQTSDAAAAAETLVADAGLPAAAATATISRTGGDGKAKPAVKKAPAAKKVTKTEDKAVATKTKTPKPVVEKVAKAPKIKKEPVEGAKVRLQAKVLMAQRKRVTFGPAFISGVLGGFHRDIAKMVILATELKMGTKKELEAMTLEDLRSKLAETILALPDGALPTSVKFE